MVLNSIRGAPSENQKRPKPVSEMHQERIRNDLNNVGNTSKIDVTSLFGAVLVKKYDKIAEKFAQFKKTSYLCTRQKEMAQTMRLREVSASFLD